MNKSHYTITVLIPTFKRPDKLQTCLDCISKQTRIAEEVIVVVRAEDQASIDVIDSFKNKMPFLKMVYSYDVGVVAAENAGLKVISNDIVAFIDDDGYAPADWLLTIESFFVRYPTASAVGGSDIIVSQPWTYHDFPVEKVGLVSWYGKIYGNHHRKAKGEIRQVQVLKGVNMALKRNTFSFLDEKLIGKDGNLGNGSHWELDLCLSILNKNGSIYFVPNLIVNHDSNHSNHNFVASAKSNTHNLCYVMLKNLSFSRKVVFLIYATLVGNSQLPGLLKMIFEIVEKPEAQTLKICSARLVGFYLGIQTYMRSL